MRRNTLTAGEWLDESPKLRRLLGLLGPVVLSAVLEAVTGERFRLPELYNWTNGRNRPKRRRAAAIVWLHGELKNNPDRLFRQIAAGPDTPAARRALAAAKAWVEKQKEKADGGETGDEGPDPVPADGDVAGGGMDGGGGDGDDGVG